MKSSRFALAGALALAVATIVWVLVSDDAGARHAKARPDQAKAGDTPAASALEAQAGAGESAHSAARRVGQRATAPAQPSAFIRKQEVERDGYDAAGEGIATALQRLAGITSPTDRAAFIRGMFARFGESRSMDAVLAIKQLPNKADQRMALRALAEGRAPGNNTELADAAYGLVRRQALEELEEQYAHAVRGRAFSEQSQMIMSLADQPDLAAALARELTKGPELASLLTEIARREVGTNPAHALTMGEGLEGKERAEFLARVASGWGQEDGAAAWAWASGQPESASLQEAIIRGLASNNPSSAAQQFGQMAAGESRQRSLDVIGQTWGATDTQAALDWANALSNAQEREGALASIGKAAPVGIGAMLGTDSDGFPFIQDVVPGGAASEAPQLGKGARIASVRDASGNVVELQGKNLEDAVKLLRGTAGTSVTMEIIPSGGALTDRQVVVLSRRQVLHKR